VQTPGKTKRAAHAGSAAAVGPLIDHLAVGVIDVGTVGIDVGDGIIGHTVHHVERRVAGAEGTETTDTDASGRTRLAGCGGNAVSGRGVNDCTADCNVLSISKVAYEKERHAGE